MSIRAARIIAMILCFVLGAPAFAAQDPRDGDVRDIKIGSRAAELSGDSYTGLRCEVSGQPLGSWLDYRQCSPDSRGLHAIRFEFLQTSQALASLNDRWQGTKIAGHPVLLSVGLDDQGEVQAIRIETDPEARMYLRKKAFLLGIRIRERYGEDGWTCSGQPIRPGQSEIGGMFVHQTCEKTAEGRRLVVETSLYRDVGQTGRDFVSSTRFEIVREGL